MSEKEKKEVDRATLIFRLGYNMGVIWKYRNLLKEFYSLTMSLRQQETLTEGERKGIIEALDKTATALLDEDKKMTSESL